MFLTNPTIEELQRLDLSVLVDMLVKETEAYARLFSQEGFSERLKQHREAIENIQMAIEAKKKAEKPKNGSGSPGKNKYPV